MNVELQKFSQSFALVSKKYWLPIVLSGAFILAALVVILNKDGTDTGSTLVDIEHTPGQTAHLGNPNARTAEPLNPYPVNHLEQPQATSSAYMPLAIAHEPIWTEHNQRLLNLEASVTALKQETKDLKEQVSQYQAKLETRQDSQPAAPESPIPAAKLAENVKVDTAPQPAQAAPIKKVSHNRHPKRQLKRNRRKLTEKAQALRLNAPIVVEAVNSWGNEKRVVVRDPKNSGLKHLRVGDNLGGWTIEGTQGKDVILHNNRGRALLKIPDKDTP